MALALACVSIFSFRNTLALKLAVMLVKFLACAANIGPSLWKMNEHYLQGYAATMKNELSFPVGEFEKSASNQGKVREFYHVHLPKRESGFDIRVFFHNRIT